MAEHGSFLDQPAARVVALLICLGSLGALAAIHWKDLTGPGPVVAKTDDRFAKCFAQRSGEIEKMVADGLVDAPRAALFKTRAEAMCRAQNPK